MRSGAQYRAYAKPSWAPPAWIFAPVWMVLYIGIAVSFGYVGMLYLRGELPFVLLLPFLLNLLFNISYTPLQFRLRNFELALLDVTLVFATLVWALVGIYDYVPWVSFINLPYLAWVAFASILQASVTMRNRVK